MPTVMLTGAAPAHLPARPITLIVEQDQAGDPVELVVDPPVQTVRPKAGMLVVPAVSQPLTVSVRPVSGRSFATPTVLHLTAIVTTPGSDDHDRVVVPSVQVSGLPGMDLLHLAPAAGQVVLSRPAQAKETALSPLGDAALIATRALIGSTHVPESKRVEIAVVVDGSVSMITAARSGAVSAAIDLLTGIAVAVGREAQVRPTVALRPPLIVDAEPSKLSAEVVARLTGAPLTTGFSARRSGAATDGVTYIVTDSIPADHDQLDRTYHVVLLAGPDAEAVARTDCAAALTVVDAATGSTEGLLADRTLLERTVGSLLTTVGAGGSP